jgi:trigger factor
MDVSVEKTGGLERRMTISLPNTQIEQEINTRLVKVRKTAKLQGFRPGKVPDKVVRQRFGPQVRQEVIGDLINSSFSKAIAQEALKPAGAPSIEPGSADEQEQFSYVAVFEVYPEIALNDLTKVQVETPEVTIGDSDVEDMIERLRKQRAEWAEVERKAAEGDRVVVDFLGTVGGETFDGGEGKEVPVVLGAGQFLPDLEKALKGVKASEVTKAKVKFPKDYPAEELKGKKAVFDITVHRVEEEVLPALDDTFFEAFGVTEGGVDAFRTDIRANMEKELAERIRANIKGQVLEGLFEANPIDVPKALVQQEAAGLQREAMQRLGVTDEAEAPPVDNFLENAQRRVGLGLLIQELIGIEKIELNQELVEARLDELAGNYDDPDQVKQMYRGHRDIMAQMESGVMEEQVVDRLLEQAKVNPKTKSFKDFMAL